MYLCVQVQLLVTSQDVENYKQIKADLDQLRSIVEKSELWVYKRQGSDSGLHTGEVITTETHHKVNIQFPLDLHNFYIIAITHVVDVGLTHPNIPNTVLTSCLTTPYTSVTH